MVEAYAPPDQLDKTGVEVSGHNIFGGEARAVDDEKELFAGVQGEGGAGSG